MQILLDLATPEMVSAVQFAADRFNADQGQNLTAEEFVDRVAAEMIAGWQAALAASLRDKLAAMTPQQVIGLRDQIDAASEAA